jgi:hypothetical protein
MPRRPRLVRSAEDCYALDLDPQTVGVRRVRLSDSRRRLMRRVVEEGDRVTIRGGELRTADVLYDFGFVTGGNHAKSGHPWLRATDRGRRWFAAQPKGAR